MGICSEGFQEGGVMKKKLACGGECSDCAESVLQRNRI